MTHTDHIDAPSTPPDREKRPTSPGDDLLARVEATVAAIVEKLSPVPQLERSLRRWRIGFFLLGAIAAGTVGVILHLALPEMRGADTVAALSPAGQEPTFVVALTADGHDIVVRRLAAAPEPGTVHRLWLVRDDGTVTALGVIGAGPVSKLPRPAAAKVLGSATIGLSLDPADAPAPAKPQKLLYTGRLVPLLP